MSNNIATTIFFLGVILCLLVLANDDYEEAIAQRDMYCDMVDQFRKSEGRYGWPDYNGNYEKQCKEFPNEL